MKVTLPKDYRKLFTLEEMDIARKIIRDMKDDDFTPATYAEIAIDHWFAHHTADGRDTVLTAKAEISKNRMAWNAYSDDSRQMDIWVSAVTKTYDGYLEIGAYLTDIWQIGGEEDFTDRMFAQYFTRCDNV